jgi:hypothetical protein
MLFRMTRTYCSNTAFDGICQGWSIKNWPNRIEIGTGSIGLILWQRVPKVQVPEPEYVYEWNPRSNKAERAKSPGVGWSSQPVTTINIDGVAVLVGITAFGALAGVAARSVSVPTNCMYFPAGAC